MIKGIIDNVLSMLRGLKILKGLDKTDNATSDNDSNLTAEPKESSSNKKIIISQGKTLVFVLIAGVAGLFIAIDFMQARKVEKKGPVENPKVKIQVAADAISGERKWTTHLEDEIRNLELKTEERLRKMEDNFTQKEEKIKQAYENEIKEMNEKLSIAREELDGAKSDIGKVLKEQENLRSNDVAGKLLHDPAGMSSMSIGEETLYDRPKSNRLYIPETSYVSGYLLTGLAVSTAMGTPDHNAPPVVIRLTGRGNLSKNFGINIEHCRILGSAYGDLSSERAFIRAEKMVCDDPVTNLITVSSVAGDVRSNGMNGIKGKVVATSTKHIQNAMLGGVISGLANSAKGREGGIVTSTGAVNTKSKNFGQMAGEGVFQGTSTAAEKVADYYLRQAEAMSPVLEIEPAVEVEVLFIKGFYFGEISTHEKIKKMRSDVIREADIKQQIAKDQAPNVVVKKEEDINYGF